MSLNLDVILWFQGKLDPDMDFKSLSELFKCVVS